MDVDKRLKELNEEKIIMEKKAEAINSKIIAYQSEMASLNKDYLEIKGMIKAFEEMKGE